MSKTNNIAIDSSYIYAPYIPIYGQKIIDGVLGIDMSYDGVVFIVYFGGIKIWYDYNESKTLGWNIKSKNKLRKIRKMCCNHIKRCAESSSLD